MSADLARDDRWCVGQLALPTAAAVQLQNVGQLAKLSLICQLMSQWPPLTRLATHHMCQQTPKRSLCPPS